MKLFAFCFNYLDPCEQPKEQGPCGGNFTRWHYNQKSQVCEQFRYGGCKGNDNSFATEIACHQQCLQPGRRRGKFIQRGSFDSTSARIVTIFFLFGFCLNPFFHNIYTLQRYGFLRGNPRNL